MNNLLITSFAALICFVLGVIATILYQTYSAAVSAAVTRTVRTVSAAVTRTVRTVSAAVTRTVRTVSAAGARTVRTVSAAVVEFMSSELPDTSIYSLTVNLSDSQYSAGEYLIHDNGAWRNVYLTQHARALMGETAGVIALSQATISDASGTRRTWYVQFA